MKKIFLASFISLSLFLFLGVSVASSLTQGSNNPPIGESNNPPIDGSNRPPIEGSNPAPLGINFEIKNPFKVGDTLYDLVKAVVNNIILPIGGVLCVLAFIYAGFLYVTARGDTAQIKTAHSALLYASVGTAILLGAWVIANAIRATVNQIIS